MGRPRPFISCRTSSRHPARRPASRPPWTSRSRITNGRTTPVRAPRKPSRCRSSSPSCSSPAARGACSRQRATRSRCASCAAPRSTSPSSPTSRRSISTSGQSVELRLPLVGRFNVHNALAAAAAGLAAGATLQQARDALSRARAVRGRMERVESGQPFSVIVDYAHTPESFDKVLGLLRPLTKGKLIAVFGSAGERDRAKRPALAEVAAKHADFFVITQEDPRLEEPAKILEEIEQGAIGAGKRKGTDYVVIDDRREAVSEAIRRAAPEDTVLRSEEHT